MRIESVMATGDEQTGDVDKQAATRFFTKAIEKSGLGDRALDAQRRRDVLDEDRLSAGLQQFEDVFRHDGERRGVQTDGKRSAQVDLVGAAEAERMNHVQRTGNL